MSIIEKIKQFFKHETLSERGFDAKEAYLRTYYATDLYDSMSKQFNKHIESIKDDFNRIHKFEEDIFDIIQMKFSKREFHCTKDVPDDLVPWIPNILGDLHNLNYKVIDLYDKVEGMKHHVLFVQWDYDFSKDYNK